MKLFGWFYRPAFDAFNVPFKLLRLCNSPFVFVQLWLLLPSYDLGKLFTWKEPSVAPWKPDPLKAAGFLAA